MVSFLAQISMMESIIQCHNRIGCMGGGRWTGTCRGGCLDSRETWGIYLECQVQAWWWVGYSDCPLACLNLYKQCKKSRGSSTKRALAKIPYTSNTNFGKLPQALALNSPHFYYRNFLIAFDFFFPIILWIENFVKIR